MNDQAERGLVALKHFEKELQLLLILLREHVDDARFFRCNRLRHMSDHLFFHDLQHFEFCLGLQPVVCIEFLILEEALDLLEVFGAVARRVP